MRFFTTVLITERLDSVIGQPFVLGAFVYLLVLGLATVELFWFYTFIMPLLSLYGLFLHVYFNSLNNKKLKNIIIMIFAGLGLLVYFVITDGLPSENEKCFNLVVEHLPIDITDAILIEQYCNKIRDSAPSEFLSSVLLVLVSVFIGHIIYQLKIK